jgi:hypothetical protein
MSTIPSDQGFKPDPPTKPTFGQVALLFAYHILLALFLAYSIYNVWPPQPWPGDKSPKANANTNNKSTAGANNANTNSTAGTETRTRQASNPNAGTNTNANPVNTGNTNSGGTANDTSPSTSNANTGGNTGATTTTNASAGGTGNANTDTKSAAETAESALSPYGDELPPPFWLFGKKFQPTLEVRLILLVLLAGAIGSYVHAASSFVDYLGNRTIISSWVWWYLLRPFIGMMLALIFYFVFRGGFVTAGVNSGVDAAANFINPFGVAALAALVGMFSKVAADKLNEVFTTLFRPAPGQGDATRGDKLGPPTVTSITPNRGPGEGGTHVTIHGTGFTVGAKVAFGNVPATAVNVINPTSLTATTPAHAAGVVDVEVTNADGQKITLPGGYTYEAAAPGLPPPPAPPPPTPPGPGHQPDK